MSRRKLATPENPDAQGEVTARAMLNDLLSAIHAAGQHDEEVLPALLLDPTSATATAYRFGVHRMAFDLDAILLAAGKDRHFTEAPVPERTVEFFLATGGTGESHEDNADVLDMVGVA
jgi:hypothetical protein